MSRSDRKQNGFSSSSLTPAISAPHSNVFPKREKEKGLWEDRIRRSSLARPMGMAEETLCEPADPASHRLEHSGRFDNPWAGNLGEFSKRTSSAHCLEKQRPMAYLSLVAIVIPDSSSKALCYLSSRHLSAMNRCAASRRRNTHRGGRTLLRGKLRLLKIDWRNPASCNDGNSRYWAKWSARPAFAF